MQLVGSLGRFVSMWGQFRVNSIAHLTVIDLDPTAAPDHDIAFELSVACKFHHGCI